MTTPPKTVEIPEVVGREWLAVVLKMTPQFIKTWVNAPEGTPDSTRDDMESEVRGWPNAPVSYMNVATVDRVMQVYVWFTHHYKQQ
jgi:hypothetical protein